MKSHDDQPLRGDAAWRAAKEQIAKRNAGARARAAVEREAHEHQQAEDRLAAARLERSGGPRATGV